MRGTRPGGRENRWPASGCAGDTGQRAQAGGPVVRWPHRPAPRSPCCAWEGEANGAASSWKGRRPAGDGVPGGVRGQGKEGALGSEFRGHRLQPGRSGVLDGQLPKPRSQLPSPPSTRAFGPQGPGPVGRARAPARPLTVPHTATQGVRWAAPPRMPGHCSPRSQGRAGSAPWARGAGPPGPPRCMRARQAGGATDTRGAAHGQSWGSRLRKPGRETGN